MRKTLFCTLAALGIVAATALPSNADVAPTTCRDGYSCYFDHDYRYYDTPIWVAPHSGCQLVPSNVQDKIASVLNYNSITTVYLYDWNGRNAYVNTYIIPPNTGSYLDGTRAYKTTDKVCIY